MLNRTEGFKWNETIITCPGEGLPLPSQTIIHPSRKKCWRITAFCSDCFLKWWSTSVYFELSLEANLHSCILLYYIGKHTFLQVLMEYIMNRSLSVSDASTTPLGNDQYACHSKHFLISLIPLYSVKFNRHPSS